MWDNRRVFHLPDDDTFTNTARRMRRELAREPLLAAIFDVLLQRALASDTTLSRLAQHHARGLW